MRTVFISHCAIAGLALPTGAWAQTPTPSPSPEATAVPTATAGTAGTPAPEATPSGEVGSPAITAGLGGGDAGSGRRLPIGGYGELHFASVNGNSAGNEVDLHRVILFVGHRFDDKLAFYSEIEIEHALEEFAIEQAYVEYQMHRYAGARAGLILVPIGIINVFHEPPTFHGVERNDVDRIIVPTTWREPGAALFGEVFDGLRWQIAVMDGLDAAGFTGTNGIRGGRQQGGEASMNDVAVAARVDYSPFLGLDLGASWYGGGAGQDQPGLSHVSVNIGEADFRFNRMGAWVRGQYARGKIGAVRDLDVTVIDPIGSVFEGYYGEAAYDVLWFVRARRQSVTAELWPFVRYEETNTQIGMPNGFVANRGNIRNTITAGVTLKPIGRVALKADYQWTRARAGNPPNVWHLGLGWMF